MTSACVQLTQHYPAHTCNVCARWWWEVRETLFPLPSPSKHTVDLENEDYLFLKNKILLNSYHKKNRCTGRFTNICSVLSFFYYYFQVECGKRCHDCIPRFELWGLQVLFELSTPALENLSHPLHICGHWGFSSNDFWFGASFITKMS